MTAIRVRHMTSICVQPNTSICVQRLIQKHTKGARHALDAQVREHDIAMTAVQVVALVAPGAKVEIEATAVIPT